MSAMRIHRLRALAVQKIAQAYRVDEIASSVMVMQGGSVFDDVAERVLKHGEQIVVELVMKLSTLVIFLQIRMIWMQNMFTFSMKRFLLG